MAKKVFVYDPTADDPMSKIRGVGRYLQILKENFAKEFQFINKLEIGKWKMENSFFINPFFNFLQPPLFLRRIAKKQIAVIHDIIPLKYPQHFPAGIKGNINIFLNQLSLRLYDIIITDSYMSKKDIVEMLRIDENKIKVIYPCLAKKFTDLESRMQNSKLNSEFLNLNSKFCIYVGDATWNKNLVNLARAIKKINVICIFAGKVFEFVNGKTQMPILKQSPGAPLGVRRLKNTASSFSNPWQKELKEFLDITKNDKRFIFAGFVDDYRLINLYQQAKLNILPSRDEGFGFSYLEAAQFGCPSVLSDIPVLHEISNDRGMVFANPSDENALANRIGELYFNPSLQKTLGSEAKKRAKFFSPNKFRREFLKVVQ